MATPAPTLVGRDEELRGAEAFLGTLESGSGALVVRGEPGIGKSSLWAALRSSAIARGMRVLSCRPTEADSSLSFLGLHDLLDGNDHAMDELPPPQREALEIALLRRAPAGGASDWRAVHVAVLEVIRALARAGPVLIAVDDLPWLDQATSRILNHVARRLGIEPVGFLLTVRGSDGDPSNLDLSALPEGRVREVALAPLSDEQIDRVIQEHGGGELSAHSRDQLHVLASGNPFFAIEIARAAARGEAAPTGQRLPIPKTLKEDVLRHRMAGLSEPAREALFIASALSRPTVDLIVAASGAPSVDQGLESAVRVGLIEMRGGEIRFSHPLFASAIYSEGSRDRRHAIHRRLSEVAPDPEQRARHRALGADAPDLDIVAALESAAVRARDRGSPAGAAELCDLAPSLIPPDHPERLRRVRMAQSDFLIEAGDYDTAAEVLVEAAAGASGDTRTEVLFRLARACAPVDAERTRSALAEALAAGSISVLRGPETAHLVLDVAEALVSIGALEEASAILENVRDPSTTEGGDLARTAMNRCRALLLASEGHLLDALHVLEHPVGEDVSPFELGRSYLVRGVLKRRAKQKRAARDDLQRALEIFRDLDADPWMSLAQGEMAKISGRRPTASALTHAESRVARLAIAGRTNREIAASLFMSVRTVEGHLSHAYAKLGVRSRTELATILEVVPDRPEPR